MQICRVLGTVVSTHKTEKLSGMKLLLTRAIDLDTFTEKGPLLVSVDTIGAGEGEVVMTVGGSSSRQTAQTDNTPVDSAI
ncbi:MAG: EutN/CcmL family microcompartment protein, partial [Synergistaceae bacterium]|nr:EutN/CcmL family microcompartment protein [Synergistaceae bacterium]